MFYILDIRIYQNDKQNTDLNVDITIVLTIYI